MVVFPAPSNSKRAHGVSYATTDLQVFKFQVGLSTPAALPHFMTLIVFSMLGNLSSSIFTGYLLVTSMKNGKKLNSLTEEQFKCLILITKLKSSTHTDVHSRLLSKLEQDKDITLKYQKIYCRFCKQKTSSFPIWYNIGYSINIAFDLGMNWKATCVWNITAMSTSRSTIHLTDE